MGGHSPRVRVNSPKSRTGVNKPVKGLFKPPRRMIMGEYRLPITAWSATDYAYLVNNQLGWVSDDDRFWVFDSEDKMQEFRKYLGL